MPSPEPTATLRPFGEDIWLCDGDPLRFYGVPFPTRMTVVRLGGGGLWLHSPVAATPARLAAITALGPVQHLVAPDKLHHLYLPPWLERFPDATTWSAPGLAARRPDLRFDHELTDTPPPAWAEAIDQLVFRGSTLLDEVVFHHRRSRTLIITDIVQNHPRDGQGWFWTIVKKLVGILAPDGGAPRDYRFTVRDRDTARRCRDAMLAWPFEQVALCHGLCLTTDARAHVERAFAWLG